MRCSPARLRSSATTACTGAWNTSVSPKFGSFLISPRGKVSDFDHDTRVGARRDAQLVAIEIVALGRYELGDQGVRVARPHAHLERLVHRQKLRLGLGGELAQPRQHAARIARSPRFALEAASCRLTLLRSAYGHRRRANAAGPRPRRGAAQKRGRPARVGAGCRAAQPSQRASEQAAGEQHGKPAGPGCALSHRRIPPVPTAGTPAGRRSSATR